MLLALLTVMLGIAIGAAMGLTGGGGSIFAIPLLIFLLGIAPLQAITISLLAVALMAVFGTITAARQGLIEYRAGLIFAVGGMVAAPLGVHLAHQFSEVMLLRAFAVLLLIVALLMWRKAGRDPEVAVVLEANAASTDQDGAMCRLKPDQHLKLSAPCSLVLAASGIATGLLSGLFGVGGGFIIVPALTTVSRLGIHRAVATSLFVMSLVSTSGVVSGLVSGRKVPLLTTGLFVVGGMIGIALGRHFAQRLAGAMLQKIFAGMMIVLALSTIAR